MEYYESIDGFQIAKKDVDSVIDITKTKNEVDQEIKSKKEVNETKETKETTETESDVDSEIIDIAWYSSIVLTFVLWFVCFIALVSNLVKNNKGKAGFSFLGILIPFGGMALAYFGKNMLEDANPVGWALIGVAIAIELIFSIISFAFWFSKRKN